MVIKSKHDDSPPLICDITAFWTGYFRALVLTGLIRKSGMFREKGCDGDMLLSAGFAFWSENIIGSSEVCATQVAYWKEL